jgi:hypothetical protein
MPKTVPLHSSPYVDGDMSAPKGIRIPVAALKGRCPRPLDDGGKDRLILAEMRLSVK